MDSTLESIWKHFRDGGVKSIDVRHNEGDEPCKVNVITIDDLHVVLTCDNWGEDMKRCQKCKYEPDTKKT
jgi:hypothetical protein